jgi:hypothetical protein
MKMDMEYRLPCRLPDIHAKIEAIGPAFLYQESPRVIGKRHQSNAFLGTGLEPISDMAPGNEQHMAGGHGTAIKQRKRKPALKHHALRVTKGAVVFRAHAISSPDFRRPEPNSFPSMKAPPNRAMSHC